MASRRKQEDKHLTILRELVNRPPNKKCFDCGQRGPTYVNMTIGAFVCTSCSGILRGLNPPQRIKSISMASFSPQEIEFLQKHGNEVCYSTWCALWDSPTPLEPESKEEQKLKDFLSKKYERKKWYSSKPRPKEASVDDPEPKPLKTLLGENAPAVVISKQNNVQRQLESTIIVKPKQPAAKSNMDLLGDLGSDPFGSSVQQKNQDGFGSFYQPPPAQNQQPQQQQQQPLFDAFTSSSSTNSQSFDLFANQPSQQQQQQTDFFGISAATQPVSLSQQPQQNDTNMGDRYAALSDLDLFKTSATQSVFSGGSSVDNFAGGAVVNTQPNPFMSPGTSSSGVAVFQQQQEKQSNPFQTNAGTFNQTPSTNGPFGSGASSNPTGNNGWPAQNKSNIKSNNIPNNSSMFPNSTSNVNNTNQQVFPNQNQPFHPQANAQFPSNPTFQQQQQLSTNQQFNQFAMPQQTTNFPQNNFSGNQQNNFHPTPQNSVRANFQMQQQDNFQTPQQNSFQTPQQNSYQTQQQTNFQTQPQNNFQVPQQNTFPTMPQTNQFASNNFPSNQFQSGQPNQFQKPQNNQQFFNQQQPFNNTPPNQSVFGNAFNATQPAPAVKNPPFGGVGMPGLSATTGQQEFGTWNRQVQPKQQPLKSNNPFM